MNAPQIITADLDKILFENRNQAYGAYDLRKNFDRRLERSLYIVALITLIFCLWFYMSPKLAHDKGYIVTKGIPISPPFEDVEPKKPNLEKVLELVIKKPELQPKAITVPQPPKISIETIIFLPPTLDRNAADSLSILENDSLMDKNLGFATTTGTKRDTGNTTTSNPPCKDCPTDSGGTKIFEPYELDAFPIPMNMAEISKRISYPTRLEGMGIPGVVHVKIHVNRSGSVQRVLVQKSTHPEFTAVVLPPLNDLKFIPAKLNKRPVNCWVILPFEFSSK